MQLLKKILFCLAIAGISSAIKADFFLVRWIKQCCESRKPKLDITQKTPSARRTVEKENIYLLDSPITCAEAQSYLKDKVALLLKEVWSRHSTDENIALRMREALPKYLDFFVKRGDLNNDQERRIKDFWMGEDLKDDAFTAPEQYLERFNELNTKFPGKWATRAQ